MSKINVFLLGLGITLVGLIYIGIGHGFWHTVFAILVMILGGYVMYYSFKHKYYEKYFCADCGQFLGSFAGGFDGEDCSRCGCNRFTKTDTGVGMRAR